MTDVKGRSAVVTGAGRGIGREIAKQLAARGATVALVARSTEELKRVAKEIAQAGGRSHVVAGDLADLAQLPAILGSIRDRLGDPDILVNNAATVAPLGPTLGLDVDDILASLALNVAVPAALSAALVSSMAGNGWGAIVNVSSGVAARPASMVGGNIYATSKAALEAHTLNLAAEYADTGVTVNAYRPGMVDTEMQAWIRQQDPRKIGAGLHDRFARSYADGALISPEQSAASLTRRIGGRETGQIWAFDVLH